MDFTMDVALQFMSMKNAQLQESASAALLKKAMNSDEAAASELLEMLPQQPAAQIPKGDFIDVYA